MIRALTLAAALAALSGALVAAHGICGKRADMIARLMFEYREVRQGAVLPGSVRLVELYASGRNRSWTILSAHPPDLLCVEAAGKSWNGKLPNISGEPI